MIQNLPYLNIDISCTSNINITNIFLNKYHTCSCEPYEISTILRKQKTKK